MVRAPRPRSWRWLPLVLATSLSVEAPAWAQPAPPQVPPVADLVPKLSSEDARVRAAAVLQLGATNDDAAVPHVCQALGDGVELVRISAASALRRLARPAGLPCLKERLRQEPSEAAKTQITRSIQAIENHYEPPNHPDAKFYVALSTVTSQAERPTSEVEAVVLKAMRQKLEGLDEFQIAPMNETTQAATKAIGARKAKGFYLAISVDKFDYSSGGLRVKINVAIFSYPQRSLIAPTGNAASIAGVSPGNTSAEDQLLAAVAGAAVRQFVATAPSL